MTPREILKSKLEKYDVEFVMDKYIDDELRSFIAINEAMEEYGKQQWNAAIESIFESCNKLKR